MKCPPDRKTTHRPWSALSIQSSRCCLFQPERVRRFHRGAVHLGILFGGAMGRRVGLGPLNSVDHLDSPYSAPAFTSGYTPRPMRQRSYDHPLAVRHPPKRAFLQG